MPSVGTIKYKNGSTWTDILHPVGTFHISNKSTSPASLFGGTWTQITSATLRGSTSTGYTGKDTTTLTLSQIPKHTHLAAGVIQTDIVANKNGGDHIVAHYTNWNITDTNGQGFITESGGGFPHKYSTFLQLLYLVSHRINPRGSW